MSFGYFITHTTTGVQPTPINILWSVDILSGKLKNALGTSHLHVLAPRNSIAAVALAVLNRSQYTKLSTKDLLESEISLYTRNINLPYGEPQVLDLPGMGTVVGTGVVGNLAELIGKPNK